MAKISRREFLKVSTMAVAGVALAACGQAAATPTATTAPVQSGPTNTPVPTGPKAPSAWPVGDVPRNRTLNYYWQASPANGVFNPYIGAYNHQTGSAMLYEPCCFYSAIADKEVLWLAESYKYNSDATELDITFRKGIKWSDGTAFKASDVAWGMTTLQTVKGLSRAGTYVTELNTATAVDDLNLQVKLKQSDYRLFFKSLTFRYDLGDDVVVQAPQMYKDVAATSDGSGLLTLNVFNAAKGWPISTGPYGVGTSTDQLTNYDIRPSWWAVDTGFIAAMPEIWRLTQTLYVNDTLAAQGLINNDYDQTLDLRPMVAAATLAQASDHLTTWTGTKMPYGYMDWWPISLWFTTPTKPWDNPDVRWAVAYAIDQQSVVDIAWGGAGVPAIGPFPGGFAALNKYMDGIKDITTQYNVLEFNLDKSAALMQKAGFTKDKDGFWVDASGVRPTANVQAPVPLFGDLAPVVVAQLRAGGFDSAAKAPPDMWTAVTDGRDAMNMYGHGGSTRDPYDTLFLYSKSAIVAVGTAAGSNFCRWTDPTFEADLEKMNLTSPDDTANMTSLFKEMMTIYYQQLPDCPLVQWFHRIVVNETYWTSWPNKDTPTINSALWHLTCLYLMLQLKATNHA